MPTEQLVKPSAEMAFRAAYERLKQGKPEVLPKGTSVSQNNVAKEANVDPSALRKSRFPSLIAEIQQYVDEHKTDRPISTRQTLLMQRKRNRTLLNRIDDTSIERDLLSSLLNQANTKIVELANKVAELQAKLPPSNVTSLTDRASKYTP